MGHKLYDILGVSQHCNQDEIKKAYKKLAIQFHPDKTGGDGEKFKEISHAYEVLSDDEKRRRYDQLGDEGYEMAGQGGAPFDPHSIFEQFFGGGFPGFFGGDPFGGHPFHPHGGRQNGPKKCRNIQHVVQMTNKDAYFGAQKTLKITVHKKCMNCIESCYSCQGRGNVTEMQRMGPFTTMATRPCHICKGSGSIVKGKESCNECKGKGEFSEEKRIELTIPMGTETGQQIVISGYGEQPQQPGDRPGDLIFEVLVQPDPLFERQGLHLIHKKTITLLESIIGKEIEIPLYEGTFTLDIHQFGIIQPNKQYKISQRGMKRDQQIGDLFLVFTIQYPSVQNIHAEGKKDIAEMFSKHITP
jgi:DnaJ family protein A protein 2